MFFLSSTLHPNRHATGKQVKRAAYSYHLTDEIFYHHS